MSHESEIFIENVYIQVLKADFELHSSLLTDLEHEIVSFRELGTSDSHSDRLEQQFDVLQVCNTILQ